MFNAVKSFVGFFGNGFKRVVAITENKFVRHSIRGGRVVFLSFVLYSTGYNSGLLDYAQDPVYMDKKLMAGVLQGTNATGILPAQSPISKRAHRIGSRIVASAISYSSFKLNELATRKEELLFQLAELEYGRLPAVKPKQSTEAASVSTGTTASTACTAVVPVPLSKTEVNVQLTECDQEVERWEHVQKKLRTSDSWSYVVTDSNEVNAFVSDLLPRRIFINKGLFDTVVPTDDELALVLGHEISHLILGHVPDNMQFEAFLIGFQLLLFSFVDPTGILTFAFDSMVSQIRVFLSASRSRECELEADALGVIIAGRACFNVERGINVMSKLMHMERGSELAAIGPAAAVPRAGDAAPNATPVPVPSLPTVVEPLPEPVRVPSAGPAAGTQWTDTHPPFESRIELLMEAHDRFADSKAHSSHCLDVESDLAKGFFHVMHKISDSVEASLNTPVHPGAIAGRDH